MQNSFIHLQFGGERVQMTGAAELGLENYYGLPDALSSGWTWDGTTLTVTSDRYGFQPLFYIADEKEFAVSTSLVRLLEFTANKELNPECLAVFLRLGFFIGDDTPFKAIKAFPPATTLIIENGEVKKMRREFLPTPKPLKLSRAEAVEIYAELFGKAVNKMLPENADYAMPISGGRDSRHILLDLCEKDFKPAECLTLLHYPPRPNEDSKIAAQLCEELDVKHTLIKQFDSRLQTEINKNRLTHFCADEHGWYLPMADYLKGKYSLFYDGIAGDVLSAGLFLEENLLRLYREEKYRELAEAILDDEGYLPNLLNARAYKFFNREIAVEHLVEELKKHKDSPNPVGAFYFWNRTRREIALAPFSILGRETKVLMPYLEPMLFDFLSAIPGEDLLNKNFHTETIRFAYPKYAHIPYEEKTAAPNLDYKHFRRFNMEIVRYSLSVKGKRIVRRDFLISRFLRSLADKNYSESVVWYSPLAIYLLQMEELWQG